MIGRYEKLNEQPIAHRSKIPFICLTDDPALTSETWRIMLVEPEFPLDQVRSQRVLKLLPYRQLGAFDGSLYIDNTVLLSATPEEILARYFEGCEMAMPLHSYRERVLDEFAEVMALKLDDAIRLSEQLDNYWANDPEALLERPYWAGVIMRDHRSDALRRAMEIWAGQVLRYSRRDQLSANYALRKADIAPAAIEIDAYRSWFHSWPVALDRKETVRTFSPHSPGKTALGALASYGSADEWAAQRRGLMAPLRAGRRLLSRALRRGVADADRHKPVVDTDAPSPGYVDCPNGGRIHVDPREPRGRALVAAGGDLNPRTLAMWRALLADGQWTHVVDAGANYGEMVVAIPPALGATVTAIEPNIYVLPYLLRTARATGLRVDVIGAAVSDQDGTVSLHIDCDWSGLSSVMAEHTGAGHRVETREVDAITLASLFGERAGARALLKLDVEGHEVAALRGLGDLAGFADFAALVEVLHLGDGDLGWILDRFTIALWEVQAAKLAPVTPASAAELRALLTGGHYYPQDAVLRRR